MQDPQTTDIVGGGPGRDTCLVLLLPLCFPRPADSTM